MELERTLEIPPSARLVLRVLREFKIADVKTLLRETGLSRRTLMYGIRRLKEMGQIDIQICLNDSRRRYYCIRVAGA